MTGNPLAGRIDLVLFDLDGTLVDSRRDLASAVNGMLGLRGCARLEIDAVTALVGQGVHTLVARALEAAGAGAADQALARADFARGYAACLLDSTLPYDGVEETLARLKGLPCAVVSNKPQRFCETILDGLALRRFFSLILGGDALADMKPSPLPLRHAMHVFGSAPERTVMVGDSVQDLRAGKAAGTATCAALYGFQSERDLLALAPDAVLRCFAELPGALERLSGRISGNSK
jgi:phosphoglycolate phosphatase